MIRKLSSAIMLALGGALAVAGIAVAQAAQQTAPAACAARSLSGAYGFSFSGTNVRTGSYAIVGRFVADGKGHFDGAGAQSVSGRVFRNTLSGTYSVLGDCTGTSTLEFRGASAVGLTFVIVNGGEEVLLMSVDSGSIETGVAKRISAPRSPRT